jgi:hypothetical protein
MRMRSLPVALSLMTAVVLAGGGPSFAAPEGANQPYSAAELRDLVGPVALYPDVVLSSLLPATTFPEDVKAAADYVAKQGGTVSAVPEGTTWDPSVQAMLQYPDVLKWLTENSLWAQQMAFAVAVQQSEVLAAIQAFRAEVKEAGNLKSDEHMTVSMEDASSGEGDVIIIESASPEVVYVPTYDYASVATPGYVGWGWGAGFAMGAFTAWGIHQIGWGGNGGYGNIDVDIDRNFNFNGGDRTNNFNGNRGNGPNRPQQWNPSNRPSQRPGGGQGIQKPGQGGWGNQTGRPKGSGVKPAQRPAGGAGAGGARPGAGAGGARPGAGTGGARPGAGAGGARPGGGASPSRPAGGVSRPAGPSSAPRPSTRPRSSGSRGSSASRSSGFGGSNGGGSAARAQSNRGGSSLQRSGGGSSGGSYRGQSGRSSGSRSSASRGGGGGRSGGGRSGGGGRGGGGGRRR